MLYFSYGMNTNKQEMAMRCPDAVCLGVATLLDHKFRFAGHADVVYCDGESVDGVLWDITSGCMAKLDALEGYPFYYNRKKSTVLHKDVPTIAMVYYMNPGVPDNPPSDRYFNTVLAGYKEHGVSTKVLYTAKMHQFWFDEF